jgi:DNA modification methylase
VTPYYHEPGIDIYVGDAREILPKLESVDMIFTDPPYGHNNNNGDLIHRIEQAIPGRRRSGDDGTDTYDARPIANDDGVEANALVQWFFQQAADKLRHGGCCCCCCGGGGPDPQFARWSLWLDEAMDFKQMVVWDKGPIGMGWHYRRSYETVLVGQKPGAACKWYDETDRIENIIRHIPKIIPSALQHPTPKPPELAAHFICLHTQLGEVVLDPFMGAGSTAEAAKVLGRKFIGIELDERWAVMAVERLRQAVLPHQQYLDVESEEAVLLFPDHGFGQAVLPFDVDVST